MNSMLSKVFADTAKSTTKTKNPITMEKRENQGDLAVKIVKSNIARGCYATLINKDGKVLKTSGIQPSPKMAKAELAGASPKTLRQMRRQRGGRK